MRLLKISIMLPSKSIVLPFVLPLCSGPHNKLLRTLLKQHMYAVLVMPIEVMDVAASV